MAGDDHDGGSFGFDVTVAHPARVYNYLLGGKDNFEADREAARQMIAGGAKVPGPGAATAMAARPGLYRPGRGHYPVGILRYRPQAPRRQLNATPGCPDPRAGWHWEALGRLYRDHLST
jgi:S-adenosyl methyltransferase